MVFEVRFPTYSGVPKCRPDTTLSGVVVLKNSRVLAATALVLTFKGMERINTNPEMVTRDRTSSQSRLLASNQWIEQVYFQRETVLLGDMEQDETIYLEPALHMYHFTCNLPFMNYPSSVTTAQFEISYTLTAKLLCPRESVTIKQSLPAAIHFEPLPLSVPYLPDSLKCFNTNVLDGDKVMFHLHASFMKNNFGPGEPFAMNLTLKPVSNRQIKSATYALKEHVECHLRNAFDHTEEPLWYNQRTVHEDLLLVNRVPSDLGRDPYISTVSFELPDFFQPNNSIYLTFNYSLQLCIKVATGLFSTGSKELTVDIPITILHPDKQGRVPAATLAPMNESASVRSSQASLTYTPSVKSETLQLTSFNPDTARIPGTKSAKYLFRYGLPIVHPPSVKDITQGQTMPAPWMEKVLRSVTSSSSRGNQSRIHVPSSKFTGPHKSVNELSILPSHAASLTISQTPSRTGSSDDTLRVTEPYINGITESDDGHTTTSSYEPDSSMVSESASVREPPPTVHPAVGTAYELSTHPVSSSTDTLSSFNALLPRTDRAHPSLAAQ